MKAKEMFIYTVALCVLAEYVDFSHGDIMTATAHLLEFGNNDVMNERNPWSWTGVHIGTPCDPSEEKRFHAELRKRANETDFGWIKSYKKVCNVFKYLRCDKYTGNCMCWHNDLFWAPEELKFDPAARPRSMDFGRYKGRCRVTLNRLDSCSSDLPHHEVLPKFKKPFNLEIFDRIPPPPPGADYALKTLDSKYLKCVNNGWDRLGRYACKENFTEKTVYRNLCKSAHYFLLKDFELIKEHVPWENKAVQDCDMKKRPVLLRAGMNRTWDFDAARSLIMRKEMDGHCNPFGFVSCQKAQWCEKPIRSWRYEVRILNGFVEHRCVPTEGVTCSRNLWHHGSWVQYYDACYLHFECMRSPDDKTRICCDPMQMARGNITMINYKKGRCRDHLALYKRHFTSPIHTFGKNRRYKKKSINETRSSVSVQRSPMTLINAAAVLAHLSRRYGNSWQ